MAGEINVGDAVLRFIGDTSQLDATFQSLPGKAQAGIGLIKTEIDGVSGGLKRVAADADASLGSEVPAAAELTRAQMREAKGEVALLGEEFGIRLPRHVRSFIAEMPGVGEALSAAFSATAILFLIEALIKGAEKLSDFISATFIFTTAMKQSNDSVMETNKLFEALAATYKKDKEALDNFGKSVTEMDQQKLKNLNERMTESISLQHSLEGQAKSTELNYTKWGAAIDAVTNSFGLGSPRLQKALDEQQNAVEAAQAKAAAEVKNQANIQIEATLQKEEAAAHAHELKLKQIELEAQAENARNALAKESVKVAIEAEVARVKLYQQETQAANEADAARTKLSKEQVVLENEAENARADLAKKAAKIQSDAEEARIKLYAKEKLELQNLKKQNELTFQAMEDAWMKAPLALGHFASMSEQAFNSIEKGVERAGAAAFLGQESFDKAIEKITAHALAQLAAQAIVKALFYTAEGVADLAMFNYAGAGQFFEAAGLMGAVGAAAGISVRALNGGAGSGSGSTTQGQSSSSNTGGSQRGTIGITGVQHFAEGGLVSSPTLALIGETGQKEAVLPLDNPETMARIGKAVAQNIPGGGGGGINVHVQGLISPDNLKKVISQINDKVNKGQVNLKSSNTFRITKRGA
jgi:hypothetical protein